MNNPSRACACTDKRKRNHGLCEKCEAMEMKDKLKQLRLDIGNHLFYKLSKKDREYIIQTVGSVDLGFEVDLDKIAYDLEHYDD